MAKWVYMFTEGNATMNNIAHIIYINVPTIPAHRQ